MDKVLTANKIWADVLTNYAYVMGTNEYTTWANRTGRLITDPVQGWDGSWIVLHRYAVHDIAFKNLIKDLFGKLAYADVDLVIDCGNWVRNNHSVIGVVATRLGGWKYGGPLPDAVIRFYRSDPWYEFAFEDQKNEAGVSVKDVVDKIPVTGWGKITPKWIRNRP